MSIYYQDPKTVNKSLFVKYLLSPKQYFNYDILLAKSGEPQFDKEKDSKWKESSFLKLLDSENKKTFRTTIVECSIGETNVKLKREVPLIENLNQDKIYFVDAVRKTIRLAEWSDEISKKIVKTLLSDEILDLIHDSEDTESIFKKIMSAKYSVEKLTYYQSLLINIRQTNFETIDEYYNAIKQTIKRISICMPMSKKEEENKIAFYFLTGLHSSTELKFQSEGLTNYKEIFKRISLVERKLLPLKMKSPYTSSNHGKV